MKLAAIGILSLIVALPLAAPAHAESASTTLKKIQQSGEIALGYRQTSIPFSYLDDHNKPVGYAIDLCGKIVDAVKTELKLPAIKIRYVPIELTSQIPLLQNETIDMVCGPATHTVARSKQAAFSNTIFVSTIRVLVRSKDKIKDLAALNGKRIALTSGSTAIGLINKFEADHHVKFTEVFGKDHAESFLLLTTNRADAFAMDDILLASMKAKSDHPANFVMLPTVLRAEPYGLILRKNDPSFQKLVNKTLDTLMANKGIEALYKKWFLSPIPPQNINLQFDISEATQQAFDHPNDRPIK